MRLNLRFTVLTAVAVLAASCALLTGELAASEITATHLVFDKAVKMKKARAVLFLPLLDQSTKSDRPGGRRLVDCRVFAEGKAGPLPVKGAFRLELFGETVGAAQPWSSDTVVRSIEADGSTAFDPDEILGLVDQAQNQNASPRLLRIEFDGGKGKKVSRLTVDCRNSEAGA